MQEGDKDYYNEIGFMESINHKGPSYIKAIARTPDFVSPGDVLSFRYWGEAQYRFTLVVSILRGDGYFISTRGNKLLACFKLTTALPETVTFVLSLVYKNRKLADYYKLTEGLELVFGKKSFRTYKFQDISYFHEVLIDRERLNNGETS